MERPAPALVGGTAPAIIPADVLPPALPCANCGVPLTGPFCAQCGQHVADYHRSVWRFVVDFLDNTFCWDNKIFLTFALLFRQPGLLTCEFMIGRRVRYVHPLRLFLFTSAVCLTLLHFGDDGSDKKIAKQQRKTERAARHAGAHATRAKDGKAVAPDEAEKNGRTQTPPMALPSPLPPEAAAVLAKIFPSPPPAPSVAAPDASSPVPSPLPGASPTDAADGDALKAAVNSAIKEKVGDKRVGEITDLGESVGRVLEKKINSDGVERLQREVIDGIRSRLSWVALAMLPIFALMLRLLYWRKDSFYFLHLVFSLHYHTFLLVFWTLYSWLGTFLIHPKFLHSLTTWCLLVVPVYLFFSLRRVYGGGIHTTWIKVALLGGMHFLAIFIGLAAIGGLAFLSAGT